MKLLGGGPANNTASSSQVPVAGTELGLRLSNTGPGGVVANLCFVNADLNALYTVKEFREFFKLRKFEGSPNHPNEETQVCNEMAKLFNLDRSGVGDAHHLRHLVAIGSGVQYLADGSQQDLMTFQGALFTCLRDDFNKVAIQISHIKCIHY